MLSKLKQHAKSKTQWWNIAIAAMGIVEVNFHVLRDNLGDMYGFAFLVVSLGGMVFRNLTTEPINAK